MLDRAGFCCYAGSSLAEARGGYCPAAVHRLLVVASSVAELRLRSCGAWWGEGVVDVTHVELSQSRDSIQGSLSSVLNEKKMHPLA